MPRLRSDGRRLNPAKYGKRATSQFARLRRGGRPGRKKERGDAVSETGVRFKGTAPVVDITVKPAEIEGLSENDYEVISERVHARVAVLEWRHVIIRYRHLKVKIRDTGALVSAPARESVFKNSCADVSFIAALLGDRGEVVFPFAGSRRHRHAAEFLSDYAGTLVSDGYGACEAYVEARNGAVAHQACWIHTRRNFWERKDSHPAMAGEALTLIGAIYAIEKEIDGRPTAERLAARRTRSRAAVDAFRDWCDRTLEDPSLTPKHPIRKAINYAVERRAALEVFLADPDVPPYTNRIENKLRPAKLGQRNWLFAWTEFGAENIGIVNGLLATCRMQDVDPRIWLTDVLLRIDTHSASRVDELMPRRWKTLFADNPMTSDVAAATETLSQAAAMGAT